MKNRTILLVGLTSEEESRIQEFLPEWQIVIVSLDERTALDVEGVAIVSALPAEPDIVLFHAQKKPEDTLAICRQLRDAPQTSKSAILLAVSRYQIGQGNDVKNLGNAAFVMIPYSDEGLCTKIARLLEPCPDPSHQHDPLFRCCPQCGKVVNGNIVVRMCSEERHRKNGTTGGFCKDCGHQLAN